MALSIRHAERHSARLSAERLSMYAALLQIVSDTVLVPPDCTGRIVESCP